MQVRLRFKTPDVVDNAINEIKSAGVVLTDEEERSAREACDKFVQYDAYITAVVDVETGACLVEPA